MIPNSLNASGHRFLLPGVPLAGSAPTQRYPGVPMLLPRMSPLVMGVPRRIGERPPSPGRCWGSCVSTLALAALGAGGDCPQGLFLARRHPGTSMVQRAYAGGNGQAWGTRPLLPGAQLSRDGSQVLHAEQHLRRQGPRCRGHPGT